MVEALHLQELLHNIAQGLLYPTMAILLALIVYAVWCIGSLVVEGIVERRHFKVAMPQLLAQIDSAQYSGLEGIVEKSGLLGDQKRDLETLIAYGYLPEESRVALAKRLIASQEDSYVKVSSRTDTAAKISPMIGLMGTLIPLGPGVVALGQAQTELLSSSIEIAFDTTIAGLVVAVVAMIVSRFRKRWYEDYMTVTEGLMAAVLEKAHDCTERGEDIGNAKDAARKLQRIEDRHPRKRGRRNTGASGAENPAAQVPTGQPAIGEVA